MAQLTSDPNLNIFESLFHFRPGEHSTPKENFLTEALVYVLRSDHKAADAWIRLLTNNEVSPSSRLIETRSSHRQRDGMSIVYPDVKITGKGKGGRRFHILVEHKWDSFCDIRQLRTYAGLCGVASKSYLCFVCENATDFKRAGKFSQNEFPRVKFNRFRWEHVYRTLSSVPTKSQLLEQFIAFMQLRGLDPGEPITTGQMAQFVRNGSGKEQLLKQLTRYCEKLRVEKDWSVIPRPFVLEDRVFDGWGRIAIVFAEEEGWRPAVALQFLYDGRDHKLQLLNARKGIDLALRIQIAPRQTRSLDGLLGLLKEKAAKLEAAGATVHLRQERGGNRHTLFIARRSLGDVIAGHVSDEDQLDAIYEQFRGWCRILFHDSSRLIKAFSVLDPYPR